MYDYYYIYCFAYPCIVGKHNHCHKPQTLVYSAQCYNFIEYVSKWFVRQTHKNKSGAHKA